MKNNINSMRKIIVITLIISTIQLVFGQEKKALLIGISEYENWETVDSDNNLQYLEFVLRNNEFTNIKKLQNKAATSVNILQNLEIFANNINSGDVIFIGLSGHGSQIEDFNADEKDQDGLDELFVSYDTPSPEKYNRNFLYIIDDTLNHYIKMIKERAGHTGLVFFVVESCFSGNIERDFNADTEYYGNQQIITANFNPDIIYKISDKLFSEFEQTKRQNSAPIIVLTACLANQKARNIFFENSPIGNNKRFGLFTYSFCQAFQQIKPNQSFINLINSTKKIMKNYYPAGAQIPYHNGNKTLKLSKITNSL